jgi:hypothetical protein
VRGGGGIGPSTTLTNFETMLCQTGAGTTACSVMPSSMSGILTTHFEMQVVRSGFDGACVEWSSHNTLVVTERSGQFGDRLKVTNDIVSVIMNSQSPEGASRRKSMIHRAYPADPHWDSTKLSPFLLASLARISSPSRREEYAQKIIPRS